MRTIFALFVSLLSTLALASEQPPLNWIHVENNSMYLPETFRVEVVSEVAQNFKVFEKYLILAGSKKVALGEGEYRLSIPGISNSGLNFRKEIETKNPRFYYSLVTVIPYSALKSVNRGRVTIEGPLSDLLYTTMQHSGLKPVASYIDENQQTVGYRFVDEKLVCEKTSDEVKINCGFALQE